MAGLTSVFINLALYFRSGESWFLPKSFCITSKALTKEPRSFYSYFKNTPKESVLASLLNKYSGWGYEQEWRFVGDPGCHRFEPECLKGVIFGYRMPKHEREAICRLLTKWEHPVKFYEVKISLTGKFALKIEPL